MQLTGQRDSNADSSKFHVMIPIIHRCIGIIAWNVEGSIGQRTVYDTAICRATIRHNVVSYAKQSLMNHELGLQNHRMKHYGDWVSLDQIRMYSGIYGSRSTWEWTTPTSVPGPENGVVEGRVITLITTFGNDPGTEARPFKRCMSRMPRYTSPLKMTQSIKIYFNPAHLS